MQPGPFSSHPTLLSTSAFASLLHGVIQPQSQPGVNAYSDLTEPITLARMDAPSRRQTISETLITGDKELHRKNKRKETQRRYSAKRQEILNEAATTILKHTREREELKTENAALAHHQSVLVKIQEFSDQLLSSLQNIIHTAGDSMAGAIAWTQNTLDADLALQRMFLMAPGDFHVKKFVSTLTWETLLAHREKLRNEVTELTEQWFINPNARPYIEKKLTVFMELRYRVMRVCQEDRPDLSTRLYSSFLMPPGGPNDPVPGINSKLLPLIHELDITPEQTAQLTTLWRRYTLEVQAARNVVSTATRDAAAAVEMGAYGSGFTRDSLSRAARDYLEVTEGAAKLAGNSDAEVGAMLRLIWGAQEVFTVLQLGLMVRRCYPYIPDPLQLCQLVMMKAGGANFTTPWLCSSSAMGEHEQGSN